MLIASTFGGAGGLGGLGGFLSSFALLDLEEILKVSGFRGAPTWLATIAAPEGGGGGLGVLLPPVVTGSAGGGGAEEMAFPCITWVMNC